MFCSAKLNVVGEEASGKTSTVLSLLGEPYDAAYKPTFGINVIEARVTLDDPEQAWDRQGNGSEGRHLIKAAAKLRAEEDAGLNEKIKRLLYDQGAGQRVEEGYVKPFQLKRLTKWEAKGSRDIFNKAKKDYKRVEIGIWDFGGRCLFHPLQSDLLTDAGVYLVVFSLPSFIKDPAQSEANLKFWLDTIHLSTKWCSVIVVGTNLDMLRQPQKDLAAIRDRMNRFLPSQGSTSPLSKHSKYGFFPVSNSTGEGFVDLKLEIAEATREQEFTYKSISTRWIRFLDLLTLNEDRVLIDSEDVEEFGNSAEVYSSEITEMVDFFRELGLIVHLKSAVPCEQKIFTKPWWLFEEIAKVVDVSAVQQYDRASITEEGLLPTWAKMHQKGVTDFEMMSYIWGKRNTPILLELLRSLTLLCPWGSTFGLISGEDEVYFIPNLLDERALTNAELADKGGLRCKVVFTDSFFPNGCFQRLVCLCVEFDLKEQDDEPPELYADCAKLTMKSGVKLLITHGQGHILVEVDRKDPALLENYSSMIVSMLRKINDESMRGALSWELLHEDANGEFTKKQSKRKSGQDHELNVGSTVEHRVAGTKEGVDLDKFMDELL